jgi:hypothetical protein
MSIREQLQLPAGWTQLAGHQRDVVLVDPDGFAHVVGWCRAGWTANSHVLPVPTRPRLHATAQSAADEIIAAVQ